MGGKYTGLALMNVERATVLVVLMAKLLNSSWEIAPVLRVALSA